MTGRAGESRPNTGPGIGGDPWLLAPDRTAETDLYCLPPAGSGAATYRKWPAALHPAIGVYRVQPPGREGRFRERFCANLGDYVRTVASLVESSDRPFMLFGHSMGAILAYEVAQTVRERTGKEPLHLFASAYRSPAAPRAEPIHHLPDAEFVQRLRRRFDGIPDAVLNNQEVLDLMLPIVRSDLALLSTYQYRDRPRLLCPITAIGGAADPWVNEAQLREWQRMTDGAFLLHSLPGGHFYLDSAFDDVVAIVKGARGA
jgi:medium-chain acyl-[acyl-carrier-protein] hydrolase